MPDQIAVAEDIPTFVIRVNPGCCVVGANRAAQDMLGAAAGDSLPTEASHVVASLTGRSFADEITALETGAASASIPVLLLGSDYRLIPAILKLTRGSTGDDGEIIAYATEVGDSSVLRGGGVDMARVLGVALDVAPNSIITIDELGCVLSFNAAAEAAFGYAAHEIIGQKVSLLMSDEDAVAHDAFISRHFHTGERRIIGTMRVVNARRRNGETFPAELYVGEVRFGDRRLYAGFLHDISARKEMQAETALLQRELIHVTRLASMGEMAAALAHELNQPLTAIAAYADAARLHVERGSAAASDAVRESLSKLTAQTLRAGEIIRRMRQLASGGGEQRNPEDLNTIVREATALASIGAKALGIETTITEGKQLPEIICDRIQVQQVIINLIRNAMDAFDDLPQSASPHQKHIRIETAADSTRAIVSVSDTGPGVAPDVRERLFQSFLTTKAQGVGLGLSISRTIIESHGGRLWLDSDPAAGAMFRFTLPLQTDDERP